MVRKIDPFNSFKTYSSEARDFIVDVIDVKRGSDEDDCTGAKAFFDFPSRDQSIVDVSDVVLHEFIFSEGERLLRVVGE